MYICMLYARTYMRKTNISLFYSILVQSTLVHSLVFLLYSMTHLNPEP